MLSPTKHTALERTVLAVSATILSQLQTKKVVTFSALRETVRGQSLQNDVLIVPALAFLFALGLIEYRPKGDLFEYRGPR